MGAEHGSPYKPEYVVEPDKDSNAAEEGDYSNYFCFEISHF